MFPKDCTIEGFDPELAQAIAKFLDERGVPTSGAGPETAPLAGAYLAEELAAQPVRFTSSARNRVSGHSWPLS